MGKLGAPNKALEWAPRDGRVVLIQRVLSCAVCLAVLTLAGCCCPRDGAPVRRNPLRVSLDALMFNL